MGIKNLKIDSDVADESLDTLGGSFTLNTGLYAMRVDLAYVMESNGGATGVVVHYKPVDGGNMSLRETYWVTSGRAKGQKNYYIDAKGRKRSLPGMLMANQVANITTGKDLGDLDTEEKTVKLYDFTAKKEVPTKVEAITDMIGKEIAIGVHKVRENRRVQNAEGEWVNGPQDRVFNEAHRVFYPDGFTTTEKDAGASEPVFVKRWTDRYDANYVDDRYEPVQGSSSEAVGGNAASADDGSTDQLFG